ncbi:Nif3-like dinuclear metal center hexameric protein [Bacteroidetes/Chlorobi group bacterium ChocPot_Mid]|jgi:dinuclear metal center YbgI/SA1388 family protein|nr:MAG: Nif3-like dinuclear metal center hexameric protein [Bacteroidetes/Chlorobi group bacterium ChocPot_Mid]
MLLEKLLNIIEENFPAASAVNDDKIGLQVQSGRTEIKKILVALELNDEVLKEARKMKCDCIITFHPLIYNPLERINNDNRIGRLCTNLIKNSISLITIHTNFDSFPKGTSYILAEKLNLEIIEFLLPDTYLENRGIGVIAKPKIKIYTDELIKRVYKICNSPIRYSHFNPKKQINKIAIVGGSGFSFLQYAINKKVDAFITADITYHKFHEIDKKMLLIDPGHYEMEQFVPEAIAKFLKMSLTKNDNLKISISNILTNPVKYYPETEKYLTLQKNNLLHNNSMVKN